MRRAHLQAMRRAGHHNCFVEDDGQLVMRRDNQLRLLDPLFAEWIRRR